jgi:hypothetical protein
MAVIWLWSDTGDSARIASHLEATFWYVAAHVTAGARDASGWRAIS